MQKHPNDGSNDNPDEFSEFRKDKQPDNLRTGKELADSDAQPDNVTPMEGSEHATPKYGKFGNQIEQGADAPTTAGANQGGAAPNVTFPEQRGAAPQNRDNEAVQQTQDQESDDRRTAAKFDDPRYGSGTRNWATSEPANRSTGSDEDSSVADVKE